MGAIRAASRPKGSGAAALGAALLLVAGCGTSSKGAGGVTGTVCKTITPSAPVSAGRASGSWPYSNGDLANTRVAAGSAISSASVSRLKQAWTFKITGPAAAGVAESGSLAANPIVRNGVVFVQDLDNNVYALALGSGKLEWEYECNQPELSGPGPNGVAVAGGRVYGETPTAVFALSAVTGRAVWVNRHILVKGQGTFGIQPTVAGGRVYLASQYGNGPGGGILIALNASTGAPVWRFNTVVGPEPGVRALGLGSGGAWETPLLSGGSVLYGIGNPYQSPAEAIAHPAVQLYTNSVVSLDAATGKLRWFYQGVPNDFKDYDMQASPISASVGGLPVVVGGGKMGFVYEMNAHTGKLIWKTPVGEHNGHDNDSLLALHHGLRLKAPYTILPGSLGGVLTNMAQASGTVYVTTLNVPLTFISLNRPSPTKSTGAASGEVEALSLATGKVEWATRTKQVALGAATVSNDLLFTTFFNGTLVALSRRTGKIVYEQKGPATTNAPIAVAGRTIVVPAGGITGKGPSRNPQIVAYTLR